MRALIAKLCAELPFRSVHADQLAMAQSALAAPVPHRVLDLHNAMWHLVDRLAEREPAAWRRALLAREARALRSYERRVCQTFDQVVTVSEPDRARLNKLAAGKTPECIPICLDSSEVPPLPPPNGPGEVTFAGAMHWPPNADGIRWFAREVWPHVERALPRARLNVLGKHPPPELSSSAPATIAVHGYLADPLAVLARPAVAIVPLHSGGGVRVKILDAWARAIPVVSTTIGAEGLEARDGEHLLLADSPGEFAAAVVSLLTDPRRAARIGRSGRRLLETRYDWQRHYPRFSALHTPTSPGCR
jgi:glycosyltransferase involved in cell wall biosynthesis